MAGANSNIQLTDLDFNGIKDNLKTFLKSQDVLKDYNYEGSALSVVLDLLAYNTQYNAYYMNMVANEMFLDTALKRSSVISHAKLLNYTPKSMIAPSATVSINVNGVTTPDLELPRYTKLMSEAIDGKNYTYVVWDGQTASSDLINQTASFENVTIKQGVPFTVSMTVNNANNPNSKLAIPNANIDTTTLQVVVIQSTTNIAQDTYNPASDVLTLDGTDKVYFLQEGLNGNYEIYFGDGIIGKKLSDGNIVRVTYLSTLGKESEGANNFVLLNSIGGFGNTTVTSITASSDGGEK
jgi:hypothetical protein